MALKPNEYVGYDDDGYPGISWKRPASLLGGLALPADGLIIRPGVQYAPDTLAVGQAHADLVAHLGNTQGYKSDFAETAEEKLVRSAVIGDGSVPPDADQSLAAFYDRMAREDPCLGIGYTAVRHVPEQ